MPPKPTPPARPRLRCADSGRLTAATWGSDMGAMTLPVTDLNSRLIQLNSEYARAIDDGRFEAWPEFFLEEGLYKLTSADNHAQGMEAGIIYADSRNML